MTGMEHAIEQAARAEAVERWPALNPDDEDVTYSRSTVREFARGGFTDGAEWAVEHLRIQGLLAPAPLREEWAARYTNGGGSVCRTRNEAEAELDHMIRDSHRPRIDEPPAPPVAGIYRRYVTAWLPADGIDRSEGGKAATSD